MLIKTFFEINQYLDRKKIFDEKRKLLTIKNSMWELNGYFIKQCRNNSDYFLGELKISYFIIDDYKEQMEEYYEHLLGFNEISASQIRVKIKVILKRLEKLRVDNNYYYLTSLDCKIFTSYHDIIDNIFKKYAKNIKGFGIGVPMDFKKYLDL